MKLDSNRADMLKRFCATILCGHREEVFRRCKDCVEKASDEVDGMESVLYVISGRDIDESDPYHNVADEDKQLVKPQCYLISTDAGASELEDFFWFIENLKTARGLSFPIDKKKFSDHNSIVEWLEELSEQLEDLYIVNFAGNSEDFHFTIMDRDDSEKAIDSFKSLTADTSDDDDTSFLITKGSLTSTL